MARTDHFEVITHYCNDVNFEHTHDNAKDATTEYADQLAEAIEPSETGKLVRGEPTPEWAPHIRSVWLVMRDEQDQILHALDSGEFDCAHR